MSANKFPFGIDPAGHLPEPNKSAFIEIEGKKPWGFDPADEPIAGMVMQVLMMNSTGAEDGFIMNDISKSVQRFEITGWDPKTRVLKVKITKPPTTIRGSKGSNFKEF